MTNNQSGVAAWLPRLAAVRGRRVITWAAGVGAVWTADVILAVKELVPPDVHGLVDCSTACLTILTGGWLIAQHFGPRLKPGQRIVSDEEYHATEMALTRAIIAGQHEPGDDDRTRLRAV